MTVLLRDPTKLIFLDRLTQLYNWWFMAQYLRERVGWLADQNIPLSVILLDLDDFTAVNESHGRLAGDVVLRQVAQLLHEGRRRGAYTVRYAGDEFFVFLEGTQNEEAMATAEQIRARLGGEAIVVPHAPGGIPVTASLGVATFPDEAQTASGLIEKVRRALAHAKRLGKNRSSRDTGERLPTDKEALRQLHRPRLLGRESELELLEKLFAEARSGWNRLLLIEGEHGLGKSRLLAELPGLARRAGFSFIQGGCVAQNRAVPYSALTPLIQEYFDRSPELVAPITARLSGPKLAALASALPFLVPGKGPAEETSPPERRRQLFQGMLDLLCLISERPLVLLIENLDWADEATLEVFLRLLSREDGRVTVCATALTDLPEEPEEGSKRRSLKAFLPSFQNSRQFHRVRLSQLTLIQVGLLASDILRHPIPARFHQQLFHVSRGVPLLVEETLKGLITRGALNQEEGTWNFDQVTPADFPVSADDAIARRLENLDSETLEVISEASVIGTDADLSVLAEVMSQDPAQTLDLVERGRRVGVFEAADPVADPGEIRFSNARLREIVHDGVDPAHRRQTHRKVAQVYERMAGPEPGEALGPIAYHFERSDDTRKAGFYREKLRALSDWLFSSADVAKPGREEEEGTDAARAGAGEGEAGTAPGRAATGAGGGTEAGTLKVRVPEASQPVPEAALPDAIQFIKTLTLASKNMRVFPEGSQLVREEVAGASAALLGLLEQIEAVTLAEQRGTLVVNGKAVEGKALAGLAQDLLRFLRWHGIRSITFARGVLEREVQEVLRILSSPAQGLPPEVAAWEELLASRGIQHVGVFPAIYLAAQRQAEVGSGGEAVLDDEGMRLSAEVFRSLAGAVDNLRLYPPENELNTAIQDRLERQAQTLLERIPVVTIALAEDSIVINGVRANPKWFGITGALLHKLLQESRLTSVTLTRGVTRADLQAFLTHLAQPEAEDPSGPMALRRLLEEQGIATIQVGSRFYAPARASVTGGGRRGEVVGGEPSGGGGADAAPGQKRSEEDQLFDKVARWLGDPLAARDFREQEIPAALNAWLDSDRTDLARRLWERIMAGLADPMDGTRQRAASSLVLLFTGASARTLAWLRGLSLDPLEKALLKETSPGVFSWGVRAGVEALKLILSDGDLTHAISMAAALGTGQVGKPDEKKLLSLTAEAVEKMASGGVFEPLLSALRGSDPARRDQGRAVLAALGEGTLQFVVSMVTGEDDEEVRKVAANLLGSLPGAGMRLLLPQLYPPTPPEVSRRVIGALDILRPELGPDFVHLLIHPDVLVCAEFTAFVSRRPRDAALRFLERALREPKPEIVVAALECVRGLKATELLEVIVRLVSKGASPSVLKACCLCLGQLKDQRAVDPLIQILKQRPRFLGLVPGLPDTVRAPAARALGELGSPQARRALQEATRDSSAAVRSTARLALSRLPRGQER